MSADSLSKFVIPEQAIVRDAMAAINDNYREVVLVEGEGGRILGVITDGDIRRALLSGAPMSAPVALVMTRQFTSVRSTAVRAEVLDLMKALWIRQVPVLDDRGCLVGLHFLEEIIASETLDNAAVIMAGGKGSRLMPITKNCPKPMVTVAGRPILERVVLHLIGSGIRHIYISINYMGQLIVDHFGDGSNFGCKIEYLREDMELGTGGALSLLPAMPSQPLLVLNGDQITRLDVQRFIARHIEAQAGGTVAVGTYQHEVPFGVVHEDRGYAVRLEEKPSLSVAVSRGMYVFDPTVLSLVPKNRYFPITDLLNQIIESGRRLAIYSSDEEWIDVGRPADLMKAHGFA